MYIIGTDKIKGVIEIPFLKRQISKKQKVFVTDAEFNSSEVQSAIKMGFISTEINSEKEGSVTRIIRCKNNSKKPLRLPCLEEEVQPNAYFDIKESDLNNNDIKTAMSKELFKIEELDDNKEITEKKIVIKKEDSKSPKKITTDTNDEIKITPADTVMPKESKKDKVVFNPNGEKVVVEKKEDKSIRQINLDVTEFDRHDEVDPNKGDPKRTTIVYDPLRTQTKAIENATVWEPKKEEVIFVDEQHEKARIASHPKLSKSKTKKVASSPFIDDQSESKVEQNQSF